MSTTDAVLKLSVHDDDEILVDMEARKQYQLFLREMDTLEGLSATDVLEQAWVGGFHFLASPEGHEEVFAALEQLSAQFPKLKFVADIHREEDDFPVQRRFYFDGKLVRAASPTYRFPAWNEV